jgi:septal ring factor EnvC (AmiA/AmiB activator)
MFYGELSTLKLELEQLRKLVRESEELAEKLLKEQKKLKEHCSHFISGVSDFENWVDEIVKKYRAVSRRAVL